MPTFEAITLTLMLATVAERISEAILEFLNGHLGTLGKIMGISTIVTAARIAKIVATKDDKIEKGGSTKLVALAVNIVIGAIIVFVFDLNLTSLILAGTSQASAGGVEALGETSGQILSVFIIGLGAYGVHQLIERITPEKKIGT